MALRVLSTLFALAALPASACSIPGEEITSAVAITNALRQTQALPPLSHNPSLTRAAQAHACDMARRQRMTHTGTSGSSVGDRVRAEGYEWRFVAENVALGYRSVKEVIAGWTGSPGHRQNMLAPRASEIGIGRWSDGERMYWTMVLAAR